MNIRRHPRARRLLAACAGLVLGLVGAGLAPSAASAASLYHEQYRPQFHFSPATDWMNDPNGLIYYKGEYNLFYQYNPTGNTWGDTSWGHATAPTWCTGRAAAGDRGHPDEMIFSGSVVLDTTNSSGFGTSANPPLVAVYTSAYRLRDPGAVARLQPRRRRDVDEVRRQPRSEPRTLRTSATPRCSGTRRPKAG